MCVANKLSLPTSQLSLRTVVVVAIGISLLSCVLGPLNNAAVADAGVAAAADVAAAGRLLL